jgi:hypothetical protein
LVSLIDNNNTFPKHLNLYFASNDLTIAAHPWSDNPEFVDLAKLQFFFIGYKNATDCINKITIRSNGVDITSTSTDKYYLKSYLFNSVKPKLEKTNKRNTFSLWEDVHNHNASMCGVYMSYWDLYQKQRAGSNKFTIQFPVQFNFDDIIHFQGFDMFPNFLFGSLDLVLQVTPDSLVWCCVDPAVSIKQLAESYTYEAEEGLRPYTILAGGAWGVIRTLLNVANNLTPYANFAGTYDKCFIQAGSPGEIASNIIFITEQSNNFLISNISTTYTSFQTIISGEQITTQQAESCLTGFSLKSEAKQALARFYSEQPMIVPAEHFTDFTFSQPPSPNGLDCVLTIPFQYVKDIALLFPERAHESTVFKNPYLNNLQLTMNGLTYPSWSLSTVDQQLFRQVVNAIGLGELRKS